jgi:hypothetical protein
VQGVTAHAAPRPRPRFTLVSALAPEEVRARVNANIRAEPRLRGIALEERIELAIDGEEHRFWSPQLVLQMRADDGGGTRLDARFGPDPYVWALYLLCYGALLVVTAWAVLFGLVQWSLDQPASALWIAPCSAVLAGLVYGASFVGQGLGSEQMYFLRATLTHWIAAHEAEADVRADAPLRPTESR